MFNADSRRAMVSYWRKHVYLFLANCIEDLSVPRNSKVRLTDSPDMTIAVYHECKATKQQLFVKFKFQKLNMEEESFPRGGVVKQEKANKKLKAAPKDKDLFEVRHLNLFFLRCL